LNPFAKGEITMGCTCAAIRPAMDAAKRILVRDFIGFVLLSIISLRQHADVRE
jgi:hypothetical protein